MKRSNLIPITRIYDIYFKYTYSDDVKKFMDEIVDIDRANVYTKDDMVAMLEEISLEADELSPDYDNDTYAAGVYDYDNLVQDKIKKLRGEKK